MGFILFLFTCCLSSTLFSDVRYGFEYSRDSIILQPLIHIDRNLRFQRYVSANPRPDHRGRFWV